MTFLDWKERIVEKGNDGKTKIAHASRKWYGWLFKVVKARKEQLINSHHHLNKQVSQNTRLENKGIKRRKCQKNKRSRVHKWKENWRR